MSNVLVTATPDPETHVFPPLKQADRSCAIPTAQALVRVVRGPYDLLFCAHSFTKHEAQLIADGWTVYEDIREQALNPSVTDS
ncbi:MAG: hypothetical protein ABR585_12880 [Gemmatimonadaceae bacterium]|nr:hypothetical protein [Actinomycetota bacterium]